MIGFAPLVTSDSRARALAERQGGCVTRDQLRRCGLTDKQIHVRKMRGDLVAVLPRVFRLHGVPESLEGRMTAAALWTGDDGFFNGPTAAYLLGLDGIERPERIWVARYSGVKAPPWIRLSRLERDDAPPTRWVNGFRICHVERVLAECAGAVPVRQAGRAFDDALRRRLTTLDRTQKFVHEWGRGRRGGKVLRTLVQGRDPRDERVRSMFESKMLAILRRIRGHSFVPDFEVVVENRRYFLDFYLPAARLGIECHSFRWHMGLHDDDARRDRRIRSLGIEILYFTWDDVAFHAAEVEREIRGAIARRAATFSA